MKLSSGSQEKLIQYAAIGAVALVVYSMLKSKLFPASGNVINNATNSLFQTITGSTQSPGAALADALTSPNADESNAAVLTDFFVKQGVTPDTEAKALAMGWTQTDVNNAVSQVQSINDWYGAAPQPVDPTSYATQKMYELPPIL